MPFASSTLDPRVKAIETQRAAKGMSHIELCRRSGVHFSTWFYLRAGERPPLADTIERLERALAGETPRRPPNVIAAFMRAAEAVLRGQIGNDRKLMRALTFERTRRRGRLPRAIAAARLRQVAIYLAAVELEVSNAEIARAIGTTRQNVHKARHTIEQLRSGAEVDTLLERCRALLIGEGT